ncbi:LPP20 family lipoprotein [Thiosulfativibrio zosterae]|uniref:Lipoprotein LPP20-like domain-containing protein n=1 Tax=Thiosulfativibrio zosterae TaxID=2675053 RepID=A0A6F8PPM6_9GAMM|nr:LPP20 family lipoprotein [Thiosulfativibrio zosterae]BBP43988.1 hypothetical protein THMIRHAT_17340 [Thiosulfativibrio zosterae]
MKTHLASPLFALSLLSLALMGCQSSPEKPSSVAPTLISAQPSWVLQPPTDTAAALYGVGSGKNRTDAIQNALADLTAKLGVKVNAQFTSQLTVKNRGFEWVKQDAQKTVSTQNETITLSQYDVVDTYQPLPTQVTVLVKTDRQRLAQDTQSSLQKAIASAPWQQTNWQTQGVITHYQLAEKTLSALPQYQRELSLLKTLTPQQDFNDLDAYPSLVEKTFLAAQAALSFEVVAKDKISQPYAERLKQHLASAQLLASPASARLEVSVSQTTDSAYEFKVVRANLQLNAYEKSGLQAGRQFQIKGQGLQESQAQNQALLRFEQQLQQTPLMELLGIKPVSQ